MKKEAESESDTDSYTDRDRQLVKLAKERLPNPGIDQFAATRKSAASIFKSQ